MKEPQSPHDRRVTLTVRKLLDAVDRALAAAREVERARAALDRLACRAPTLRVVNQEQDEGA